MLLLFCCILFFTLITPVKAAVNPPTSIVIERPSSATANTDLQNALQQYYLQLNCALFLQKRHDFHHIISGDSSKLLELLEAKTMMNQYRRASFRFKITSSNYIIQIHDITLKDQECQADLTVSYQYQYAHLKQPTYENIHHYMVLRQENNTWKVVSDISSDDWDLSVLTSTKPLSQQIEDQKKKIKHQLDELTAPTSKPTKQNNLTKDATSSTQHTTYSFDLLAMSKYTQDYWKADHYNPRYGNFGGGLGGDCTNFVSQIVAAGGAPQDYSGEEQWFYENYDYRSPSWTGVDFLYHYLMNNSGYGPHGIQGTVDNAMVGDIIQLQLDDDPPFDHSVTIVYHQKGTALFTTVAAHSDSCYNKPLYEYEGEQRWIHLQEYQK